MDANQFDCDVLIAGGGPVGLSLALGLSKLGAKVELVEAIEPKPGAKNSFDGRVLALSEGSRQIFQRLNLWQNLQPLVTEIHHVHVSQQGYFGLTTMHAAEMDVPALGYSIRAADLGEVLWQQVKQDPNIQIHCPASLQSFAQTAETSTQPGLVVAQLTINGEVCERTTKLIIGADGTNSQVRKTLGLPLIEKSYDAWAILAQVDTEKPHQNWAFERFTSEGPVALLPLNSHSHKLVYVAPTAKYQALLALNEQDFIAAFVSKMGERFGTYQNISKREAYPLKETYVKKVVVGRAILMGNASHTQHPVAAQGLNLGLRDVDEFLQAWQGADQQVQWLANYEISRQQDHQKVMGLTDGLIKVFEHSSPLVGHARGLALIGLQLLPGLKKRLARFSMQGAK